jgi:hypothetical protein
VKRSIVAVVALVAIMAAALTVGMVRPASAALPPGTTVQQWNRIAEDTVVASGAFQNEGLVYMAYVSAAVYDAVVAVNGGYQQYGTTLTAPAGASTDAAVVEAAYQTLLTHFPAQAGTLGSLHTEALAAIPDGTAKTDGQAVGQAASTAIVNLRSGDGRMTPIAVSSTFPTKPAGPGVWRRTPPAFAAPQTPWVASVRPFVLNSADQFLPGPPPSLSSSEWVDGYNELKAYGAATGSLRSDEQTAVAKFWTANVIRQYNVALRELASAGGLSQLETARLAAMVNVVAADAQISVMYAKYHYLFWRPVTAIDPTAVTADGFGPVPGYDDGNAATSEQVGWRPLIATPNHPEYPAAHGSLTSAMAEVFSTFLGTNQIDLDIHGFDAAGAAGNLDAVRHFEMPNDLRSEIIHARTWAGLHYHFSGVAGVSLGRSVAKYDVRNAFQPIG